MSDTQWPRFEVFKQDKPDQPHRNVGSVHAADAEMALMNARDVFARRPACHSLWVVPADVLFSQTAEELAAGFDVSSAEADAADVSYAVFNKPTHRPGMTYVDYLGDVQAPSPDVALVRGRETFGTDEPVAWWVCPRTAIHQSDPGAADDYSAATSKLFRMPNQYRTVFTMQKIKRDAEQDD